MPTTYVLEDNLYYGYSADMSAYALKLTTGNVGVKYFNFSDATLYVWSGTAFVAM